MKNEPWVRFGIFMSPKMREKPADSRNSRPPNVMLLTASTSQRLMTSGARGPSALHGWIVARVHGLGEEPLLLVGPELAHLRIRLDRGVDELVALLLAAPDVEVAHDVAEVIEAEGTAGGVGERDAAKRPDECVPVIGLAARLLEGGLRDQSVDVEARGVGAGDVAVLSHHPVDELLVARRVDVVRVEVGRDHPDRF